MSKKIKILMCSFPGGNRGPGNAYRHHINSLKNDDRIDLSEINNLSEGDITSKKLSDYDVFWFYVRFDPRLYFFLKNSVGEKVQFWFGPNILFEKAELGPSDDWERWFVNNVKSDSYFNLADFYIDRVKQFYNSCEYYAYGFFNTVDFSETIPKESILNFKDRKNDLILYYKNRRIDNQLDSFFENFVNRVRKKYSFEIVKYGSYERLEYLKNLGNSKLNVWLSIEDFCAGGQLESIYMNTPVMGTPHNNTYPLYDHLNVEASTINNKEWIRWKEEKVVDLYSDCIDNYFEKIDENLVDQHCELFMKNFDYSAYSEQVCQLHFKVKNIKMGIL
tara:strand:+ start:58 stop:1056 length:999 start_codon:yes stop_codon:yes gene_type:complete